MLQAGMIIGGWDKYEGGQIFSVPLGGTILRQPFAIGGIFHPCSYMVSFFLKSKHPWCTLPFFSQITYCLHFCINLNLHTPNLVKKNLALLRNMNHIILLILFSVCYILYCFWLLWRYLWRLAGSGSSYLYALLDHEWREGMSQEEAEVCSRVPCLDTN